jgi:polysaccharide biosynthesis protein PslG
MGVLLLLVSLSLATWTTITLAPWEERSTRPVSAAEHSIPHTAVNPYSVNTFLSQEVEPWKREKTMEMISMAGIGWIKEGFPWSEIEPNEGSFWDPKFQQDSWEKYDAIVDLAEKHGVRIIARLDHTPEWAREDGTDYNSPPSDPEDFGRFVGAFVERYSDRVQHIQIWNEPNLSREWGGEIDPEGYMELLREAYRHAKEADPHVVVLSAPMAMTNEETERAMPEHQYWQHLYDLGVSDYFDVLTATGYGIDQPPEEAPSWDRINLRRIELLRMIMVDNGDEHKPIWLTEYGWNASPDTIPTEQQEWGSVSNETQAEWTSRGIRYMSESWDWFGVSSIWYFRQVGLIPSDAAEYYFAMVDLEFTPRQVYLSVRNDAIDQRVAIPGTYGPLEAPIQQTGRWPRFESDDSPTGEVVTSDTWGSEIRIEFSGTDLTLHIGDEDALQGHLYVTLNAEPAQEHLFSHDHLGRTYIDLDALPPGTTELPVVERYQAHQPQQTNVFVMHVHENAAFSLAAIEVEFNQRYERALGAGFLSIAGMVASIVLIRRKSTP